MSKNKEVMYGRNVATSVTYEMGEWLDREAKKREISRAELIRMMLDRAKYQMEDGPCVIMTKDQLDDLTRRARYGENQYLQGYNDAKKESFFWRLFHGRK